MSMTARKFNSFCTSHWINAGQKSSSPYKLAADRECQRAVDRVEILTAYDPLLTVAAPAGVAVMPRLLPLGALGLAVSLGLVLPYASGRSLEGNPLMFSRALGYTSAKDELCALKARPFPDV